MKKFFSFNVDMDFVLHDTAAEAQKEAKESLEAEQDCAGDGWREEVEGICWGEIGQHVAMTKSTPTPGGRFDSIDEYELVDAPGERIPALLERLVEATERSQAAQERWLEYTMRPRPLFTDYDHQVVVEWKNKAWGAAEAAEAAQAGESAALEEVQGLRELQRLYREKARCACGEDEACLFARQRDAARQELLDCKKERQVYKELLGQIDAEESAHNVLDSIESALKGVSE